MRILFVNYEYPPIGGGGGAVMAALAAELADRGHDVTVLTSGAFGLLGEVVEHRIRVLRVPVFFRRQLSVANLPSMAAYLPMAFLGGLRLARNKPFDLINTHFAVPSGPVGDWLSRRLKIPNVLSVHGGDLFDPSKSISPHRLAFLHRPIRGLLQRAHAVVAQSHDTARNVSDIYHADCPVDLVPLGISRPPQRVQARRSTFGIPETAFVLTTVGRVVRRKATAQLVRMLAATGRKDIYLLIVGDGPQSDAVIRMAESLQVADRVKMLGHVSDSRKFAALSISDLFVSTSQHEGFGLVFLEAMAFGLPIVCCDRGGQVDFLSTPSTGAVIPLNDIDAFTRAVLKLYSSPQARQVSRNHNLAAVEAYFIDRCARRYEEIFERTVLAPSKANVRAD